MVRGPLHTVLRHLRQAARATEGDRSDVHLLERFVRGGDEAAFELLLWRHGPMVLSVCRGVLHHTHDAEDAFQATFLILARKAGSISKRESLASWLHRVAFRVALRARSENCSRYEQVKEMDQIAETEASHPPADRELRPLLDEEVNRLPDKYRIPIILCYFEGKTLDEASRHLGRPRGTIGVRLMRARTMLRGRLLKRGIALSAAASFLTGSAQGSRVSASLLQNTLDGASALLAGTKADTVSVRVAHLTEGMVKTMVLAKWKIPTALLLLVVVALSAGATLLGRSSLTPSDESMVETLALDRPAREGVPRQEVPSERDGVLLFIGTDIKKGEKVPPDLLVQVKVGEEAKQYRRLRVGDRVEAGQLLARVDDRLAREEVAIKNAKLEATEADRRAATKTKEEAQRRYEFVLRAEAHKAVSNEDVRGAKLTWDRYVEEENAKIAAIKQAQAELRAAHTIVQMHEIRSDISGVIKAIYRHKGEAVKALEPVFLIVGEPKPVAPPAKEHRPDNRVEVPAEREGKLLLVGTEIKPGEIVPENKKIRAKIGFLAVETAPGEEAPPEEVVVLKGSKDRYRRWKEGMPLVPEKVTVVREEKEFRCLDVGEEVKEGQLLALVSPILALDEVAITVAKLDASEAERRETVKRKEDAIRWLADFQKLIRSGSGSVSQEEYRAAAAKVDRYKEEELAKTAVVRQAQHELHRALTVLSLHEIRSPIAGIVRALYKARGEGVRSLQPVLQIEGTNRPE
jgi:RNA polymerase sigma factor (sigma-70 family)